MWKHGKPVHVTQLNEAPGDGYPLEAGHPGPWEAAGRRRLFLQGPQGRCPSRVALP